MMNGWRSAAVLLATPAVLVAAFLMPRFLVPDGVAAFEGDDRWRAKQALTWAEAELDDTPEELITTVYRVEEVGPCDGPPATDPPDPPPLQDTPATPEQREKELHVEPPEGLRDAPASVLAGYSTYRVRLYTVFGIPYGEELLGCDEQR